MTNEERVQAAMVSAPDTSASAAELHGQDSTLTYSPPVSGIDPTSWWYRSRSGVLIAVADLIAMSAAAVGQVLLGEESWQLGALTVVSIMAVLSLAHLYRSRFTLSFLDDLPRLLLVGVVTAIGVTWLAPSVSWPVHLDSVASGLVVVVALIIGRAISYPVVDLLRARAKFSARVVIIGGGEVGHALGEAIASDATLGLDIVGYVDDDSMYSEHNLPAPVLGTLVDLPRVVVDAGAEHVIVAFPSGTGSSLVEAVRSADRLSVEIAIVPRLFELSTSARNADEIRGIPLIRLNRTPYRSITWPLKRLLDIIVSGVALILLSPLLLIIAILLRRQDGPGVIFRQTRVGIDRVPFELMKFRSLKPVDEDESQTKWNVHNDQRMSRLGKLLRKTSVDELPQLVNILRGDMSLVGPRPERPHFVETFAEVYPRYGDRHRVPSGLTGWAQIHGLRGDTSIEERARYDNYYIENWSLWLDFKIMLRTATKLMNGSG